MTTKRYDLMTPEEKQVILQSPGGMDRLLRLQENHLTSIRNQITHLLEEIRDKETIVVSWTSLIIVLGLFQVFQVNTNFQQQYIFFCLPSFIFAFLSAAMTLQKHPSYIMSDFFTPEDEDKKLRFETNEDQTNALTKIYQSLYANYERKNKIGKFVGPSVMTNFATNILFLLFSVFVPKYLNNPLAISFGTVSIFSCFAYALLNTKSLTISYKRKL